MFHVRTGSGEPIYLQLVRQVKHAVASGVLAPDERLPTVRELAADLVVNPNTVARAYRELERANVVESIRGRGTFVRADPPVLGKAERRRRLKPVLEHTIAEARALGFDDDELIAELERELDLFRPRPPRG